MGLGLADTLVAGERRGEEDGLPARGKKPLNFGHLQGQSVPVSPRTHQRFGQMNNRESKREDWVTRKGRGREKSEWIHFTRYPVTRT